MTRVARIEGSLPLESLLRLKDRGPRGLDDLIVLIARGDWKARAAALSAAGRILRDERLGRLPARLLWLPAHLPVVRRLLPGARRESFAASLANAFADRAWIVRTAAALAVGECGARTHAAGLRMLLADPFRPVRIAAAAALCAAALPPEVDAETLLAGSDAAPARLGDVSLTVDWLGHLAAAHRELLGQWRRLKGATAPATDAPAAWGAFLAGDVREEKTDSREAEILRYAQEKEHHYHFTKPFTPVNRGENVRLLHSFLVVAEQLRVPQDGLVLDLGGGSAWVSELLAKLGFKPVTLDLAPALLRIGRDRFTREHLPARLACGDMTALPFASERFDAVVVIDALHHVPDVPAVFREAFRVLSEGGQFILAEPGEGHAETEKSRGEMLEHGVCEREVHLFEAVGYGEAAGFDRIAVVPHHVPQIVLAPEDLRAAMFQPSERWRAYKDDQPVSFDEYLMQAMLSHPILVFSKGERALDTRMPRELRAALRPALTRDGARLFGRVEVENAGDTIWLRSSGDRAGHVRLGLQLMTPDRKLIDQDFARGVLDHDVAPGERATVTVDLRLPDASAAYVIKLDLVDEHVCWFEDRGSRPLYLSV